MTLESALVPIPSEITMPFSGFLAAQGYLSLHLVILVGALGNLAGSLIAYGLGFYLEETVIVTGVEKYGRFLLISKEDYLKSVHWFKKYGQSVTFFSRLLPIVRTFISLPAGLSEMSVAKFSIYTFVGSILWSAVLTYIGFYLGNRWASFEGYFRQFQILITALLIIAVLFYLNHKLKLIKLPGKKS